jgi:hypothetical protein
MWFEFNLDWQNVIREGVLLSRDACANWSVLDFAHEKHAALRALFSKYGDTRNLLTAVKKREGPRLPRRRSQDA